MISWSLSAELLGTGKRLEVKHSDIGLDLDKNTHYDVQLPRRFKAGRAFVIRMKLGAPQTGTEKLMDAKM